MRILWEILTVVAGVGVIFGLSKGFPQFGRVIGFLVFNPIGLICLIGLVVWIIVIRKRALERRAQQPR